MDTPARRHTTRVARGTRERSLFYSRRTAGLRASNRDVASLRAECQLDTGVYFESRSASFIEAIITSKYIIRFYRCFKVTTTTQVVFQVRYKNVKLAHGKTCHYQKLYYTQSTFIYIEINYFVLDIKCINT